MKKKLLLPFLLVSFASNFLFAQNLTLRDRLDYATNTSDVWGWSNETHELAIVGLYNGTSIVDVTNPDSIEQIHFIYGNGCTWRDIKTFGNYAYVTQDCNSQTAGLTIIDLSDLDSITRKPWRTDGTIPDLKSAHNIFIDEFGFAYIVGHNFDNGGVLILDLNQDPLNPTVVARYSRAYVHDCVARNNRLYTAEYSAGRFSIIDVSDKNNLTVLADQETPAKFSHNIWLSDDSKTAFTTDENAEVNTSVAAYDISDLSDIKLLDEYNSTPTSTPHNVHVLDDFLVTSHYSYGLVVLDGSHPDKLVEVAHYDTEPNISGDNYQGCWGAYPYLPSGNILASDQAKGLHVFTPSYKRAIQIRGTVLNALTHVELYNASIEIEENGNSSSYNSDLEGKFKSGFANSGNYTITVSLAGYQTYTAEYSLTNGDFLELEIELLPEFDNAMTVFHEVDINESITVCDNFDNSLIIDTVFSCNGLDTSVFGSWTFDNGGCITYTAGDNSGNFIDTVCFVAANESGEQYNVTEAVISILNSTTTNTLQNVLENGNYKLMQNPVKNILYLKNNLDQNTPITLSIYDINGRIVHQQADAGFNDIISMNTHQLSRGLYILTITSSIREMGYIKFIKD
ncbi:MAG: choice-of-anchor B family protein [Chitinophagales bacterium]